MFAQNKYRRPYYMHASQHLGDYLHLRGKQFRAHTSTHFAFVCAFPCGDDDDDALDDEQFTLEHVSPRSFELFARVRACVQTNSLNTHTHTHILYGGRQFMFAASSSDYTKAVS